MLSPRKVSAKLKIQPSTLQKYSALLEQEGIITAVYSGKKSLEEVVIEAPKAIKQNVSVSPRERDSDDIAAATLEEVKQLRIQLQEEARQNRPRSSKKTNWKR